ncbi:MAG: hypothetical protein V5A46_01325 [Haloferacaceae archaeon]
MPSPKRRPPIVLALLLLTAGCLGSGPAAPSPTPETPTPPSHEDAMNEPDPDKVVYVQNDWNRSVEVQVRVVRDSTNETVHEGTYDLSPGEEQAAYDVSEADPDGVESFTVVATARDATERVTIETNRCYGNVHAEIQADGTLYLFYEIC